MPLSEARRPMVTGGARSRSWFFTVKGLLETGGRFIWGRISLWWSCVNCGGGDCRPGSGWLAGPMVCCRPPYAALVYTSVGDSEGSAAPRLLAAPAATFSCARSSHLFSTTLARTAAALWSASRAAGSTAASLMAVAASALCSAAAAISSSIR